MKRKITLALGLFILIFTTLKLSAEDIPNFTHELIADANYYVSGPQQSRPPEGKLKKGTQVTLMKKSGSYSLVQNEKMHGYVSSAALQPLKKK